MGSGASGHTSHGGTDSETPSCDHSEREQKKLGKAASSSSLLTRRKRSVTASLSSLFLKPHHNEALSRLSMITGASSAPNDGKRHIAWTKNFAELYALGAEVMPATHNGIEVRHAMKLKDGERVVIKVRSKKTSFLDAAEQQEWRINTEIMLNLPKSGCIAQLYEVLEDATNYYIVMERVEGEDLFETTDCRGRLPMSDCREIIRQLVSAVAVLHSQGLIHKDLKLENVMYTPAAAPKTTKEPTVQAPVEPRLRGSSESDMATSDSDASAHVKIIDFDTCTLLQPEAKRQKSKCVLGTDQYISQEAYAGRYSPASDMFAVGVIAYKILTGTFPFSPALFDDEVGENYVGSPKMAQIQQRVKKFDINWKLPPFIEDVAACEFCRSLLASDEHDRLLAADALKHAWLNPDHGDASPGTGGYFPAIS